MSCIINITSIKSLSDKPQNYIYSNCIPIFFVKEYRQYLNNGVVIDKRVGMNFTFPTFMIKDNRFGVRHKIQEISAKLAYTAGYHGIVKVLIDSGTKSLSFIDNQGKCELSLSMFYISYDNSVTEFQTTSFDSPTVSAVDLFDIPNEVDINHYYKDITLKQLQDTLLIMQIMST